MDDKNKMERPDPAIFPWLRKRGGNYM